MDYYLLLPNDTVDDVSYDTNLICTISFNKMWPGAALKVLFNLADQYPEQLENCTIKTDTGKIVTIEEFLDIIEKLHIAKL